MSILTWILICLFIVGVAVSYELILGLRRKANSIYLARIQGLKQAKEKHRQGLPHCALCGRIYDPGNHLTCQIAENVYERIFDQAMDRNGKRMSFIQRVIALWTCPMPPKAGRP